jgi:hypothetical protein
MKAWQTVAVVGFAACIGLCGGIGIESTMHTTPCRHAVAAANTALTTASRGFEIEAAMFDAAADGDVSAMLASSAQLDALTPTMRQHGTAYRTAREDCAP